MSLSVDAVAVALGFAFFVDLVSNPWFSLEADRSIGETGQYVKQVVAIGAALVLHKRRRAPVYLFAAVLIAAVLLDDVTRYHERAGAVLVGALGLPALPRLRPQDLGEVFALATWAVPIGAFGAWTYLRSEGPARRHARLFGAGIALLALFGVVVDLVHQAFVDVRKLNVALQVLEEGGELVAMSVIVAGVVSLARRTPRGPLREGHRDRPEHAVPVRGDGAGRRRETA